MRRLASLCCVLGLLLTATPASAQLPSNLVVAVPVTVLELPVAMATRPGDAGLYFVEKVGRVSAVRGGIPDPIPVLDLTAEVSNGLEQGLLGLAFSPDGAFMYVNLTDTAGDTRIIEFAFSDGRADVSTRREVLFVDQPFANHNGGHLAFGPDGYLYAGLGDGGDAGDPFSNAQNLGSLLGKLLRIDPRPSGDAAYTIPAGNPFVGVAGARPEIWAYGLRNPWKFSFDRATGDLWIGDVGQGLWEEVDLQPASSAGGENYGWDRMEGNHTYEGAEPPANHTPPIAEYRHETGACSITGGHVYRGRSSGLSGAYIYGDWCDGRIRYLRESGGVVTEAGELLLDVPQLSSFGEDQAGNIYAISLGGPVLRLEPVGI